jgi:hypothetical protein
MKRFYYKIRFRIANLVDKYYTRKLGRKFGFPIMMDDPSIPRLARWAFEVVIEE